MPRNSALVMTKLGVQLEAISALAHDQARTWKIAQTKVEAALRLQLRADKFIVKWRNSSRKVELRAQHFMEESRQHRTLEECVA